MFKTLKIINQNHRYVCEHYGSKEQRLPIVISKGKGIYVWDKENNRYIDCVGGYSALSLGHCHPEIIETVRSQINRLTLTCGSVYNDQTANLCEYLCLLTKLDKVMLMNSGAEAVEKAIKISRRWGYINKGVEKNNAEIIVCNNNFHGRTTTVISASSNNHYKSGFSPLTPGFVHVNFNDIYDLNNKISKNTVAFIVEPIQGEGGIICPDNDYLNKVREVCSQNNILLILDEIQTGLGRTGKMFCYEYNNIKPDILLLGKALSGGMIPISAVIGTDEVMSNMKYGSDGSTFGGNPLACAVGIKVLDILLKNKLSENANEMGKNLREKLRSIMSFGEIRGKGLMIGIELLSENAFPYCLTLLKYNILAIPTDNNIIRITPPLIVSESNINEIFENICNFCEN